MKKNRVRHRHQAPTLTSATQTLNTVRMLWFHAEPTRWQRLVGWFRSRLSRLGERE